MIKPSTMLVVSDNCGAIKLGCINVPKPLSRVGPSAGQTFMASVKENVFKKRIKKKSRIISKSQILKAVVLTTARNQKRIGNFLIKSSKNSAAAINQYELPYGTRVFGAVFREVRQRTKFKKLVGLVKFLV